MRVACRLRMPVDGLEDQDFQSTPFGAPRTEESFEDDGFAFKPKLLKIWRESIEVFLAITCQSPRSQLVISSARVKLVIALTKSSPAPAVGVIRKCRRFGWTAGGPRMVLSQSFMSHSMSSRYSRTLVV